MVVIPIIFVIYLFYLHLYTNSLVYLSVCAITFHFKTSFNSLNAQQATSSLSDHEYMRYSREPHEKIEKH